MSKSASASMISEGMVLESEAQRQVPGKGGSASSCLQFGGGTATGEKTSRQVLAGSAR